MSLRTGRLGGAGNPLTCRGPISISVSAAPTCKRSGIQVARSDDAPRINGSERTRPLRERRPTNPPPSPGRPPGATEGPQARPPPRPLTWASLHVRLWYSGLRPRFVFAGTGVPLLFFKIGGSRACGRARQNGQRFLGAPRAVVCIEAAGSVRCVWGARADAGESGYRLVDRAT